jgi:hypothetical protein
MRSGLFENVMTDVSGIVRLESEDPRWVQLFGLHSIPHLVDDAASEIERFGNRLIEHNPRTGNLIQMLEQTATRLHQVTSRKSAPFSQVLEQCCVALYLSSLLMHHFVASLSHKEVSIFHPMFCLVLSVSSGCVLLSYYLLLLTAYVRYYFSWSCSCFCPILGLI